MKNILFLVCVFIPYLISCTGDPGMQIAVDTVPPLFPDIAGVTVPVNIAPLNFRFTAEARSLQVLFEGRGGNLQIKGKKKIIIPLKKWRGLLSANSGGSLKVTVVAEQNGKWLRYKPFSISIKTQPVDPYLVYRRIAPGYESWSEMGIYQRDLQCFDESPLINNRLLTGNCMNCHSFNRTNPSLMMFHLRGNIGATMLMQDGKVTKLNTKTDSTISNCVYPYWHPSGLYIAFSVNKISQVFHTMKEKRIEVMDSGSDLVIYDIKAKKLITSPAISGKTSFETFPVFSSDSMLYFCSAAARTLPDEFNKVKYSLCRISFDPSSGSLGTKVDTVISSFSTGQSISFPRPSYDGKYLMFTMSDYGNFSIWHKEADLWLLDLASGKYRKMDELNSPDTESYHSWSSSSRWVVFSSRRTDGLYTQPFIAWIGEDGIAEKPFLLPQKDPDYYDNTLYSFNVPEFVSGRVMTDGMDMLDALGSEAEKVTFEKR